MKKMFLIAVLLAGGALMGQTPHVPQLDTLWGKESTYFYPPYFWYDLDTCHLPFWYHQFFGDAIDQNLAWKYYTDSTIRIVGVALAAQPPSLGNVPWTHWDSLRYLNVVLYDAGEGELIPLAQGSADLFNPSRWMKFATERSIISDEIDTFVVPIQEVYFDKPITENDSFYVGVVGPQGYSSLYALIGCLHQKYCSWDVHTAFFYEENWRYRGGGSLLPFIFPIIDSTGWYLRCAEFVCPGIDEVNVSVGMGSAIVRWECDTLQQRRWQVSYGPEGTAAGGGRVIDCRDRNTLLYGLSDTVRYVAYVRGYCTECSKWGEWSEGIVVYVGEREGVEGVERARGVEVVPNPASGRFEVRSAVEILEVEVHDARGVAVARSEAKGSRVELDANGWPAGVYIVTVRTRSGEERRRVVVE